MSKKQAISGFNGGSGKEPPFGKEVSRSDGGFRGK